MCSFCSIARQHGLIASKHRIIGQFFFPGVIIIAFGNLRIMKYLPIFICF